MKACMDAAACAANEPHHLSAKQYNAGAAIEAPIATIAGTAHAADGILPLL